MHQDVVTQNGEQPTIEGLNENGLVLLKLHNDIVTHMISKSMEKDPLKRYSTVAEMMETWEQAVHHYESY